MKKEMLINVLQPEEIRIAIVEDGVLEELYVERASHESYVGNIYKGRIVNIEPSIQAAFVDFGVGRNGFLHVSDVEPAYYRHLEPGRDYGGNRGRDRGRGEGRDRDGGRDGGRGRGRDGGRDGARDRGRRPSAPQRDYSEMLEDIEDEILETPADATGADLEAAFDEPDAEENFPNQAGDDSAAGPEDREAAPGWGESPPEEQPISELVESSEMVEPTEAAEPTEAPAGDDPPAKGRRRERGRGRGRRGRPKDSERPEASETNPPPQAEDKPAEAPPPSEEPKEAGPPRDWPRLMESAEHRTSEGDAHGPNIADEELSFSMAPAPEKRHEPARSTEPRAEPPQHAGYRAHEPEPEFAPEPTDFAREELPPPGDEVPEEAAFEEEPVHAEDRAFPEGPEEEFTERFQKEEEDEAYEPQRRHDRRPDERRFEDQRPGSRDDRRGGGRRDDRGRDERRGGPRRGPGRPGFGRPKPLIQDIFKRGQEVLVQVIKEGIGTKGPTLSTYISIAGRYLVLMPGLNRIGVSRKIIDEEARHRLRDILHELQPPRGIGFIIRTAGLDRNKKELQRDLAYLSRLWEVVVRRVKKIKGPGEIYQESDMITRTIRDIFTGEIDTIWVDEANAYEHAKEFLQIVMPRYVGHIRLYDSSEPMFHRYGIETEIARIQRRHVPLPAGGSVVIDQTEALVAIDVNSGNFRADNNAEETAYQMNLQAAKEIARQLRLRDLGGVIVNDFIDMREEKHRRGVEKALRDAIKRDRARTKILKISQFGIIEMTRQRIRPSLKRSVFQDCPHCRGTGQVKTGESMSIDVMRLVQLAAHREAVQRIEIRVQEEVANYLLNRKRKELAQLEGDGAKQIAIRGLPGVSPEHVEFLCYDNNNNEVKFLPFEEPVPRQVRGRR